MSASCSYAPLPLAQPGPLLSAAGGWGLGGKGQAERGGHPLRSSLWTINIRYRPPKNLNHSLEIDIYFTTVSQVICHRPPKKQKLGAVQGGDILIYLMYGRWKFIRVGTHLLFLHHAPLLCTPLVHLIVFTNPAKNILFPKKVQPIPLLHRSEGVRIMHSAMQLLLQAWPSNYRKLYNEQILLHTVNVLHQPSPQKKDIKRQFWAAPHPKFELGAVINIWPYGTVIVTDIVPPRKENIFLILKRKVLLQCCLLHNKKKIKSLGLEGLQVGFIDCTHLYKQKNTTYTKSTFLFFYKQHIRTLS
jgi:hypothetical protein